MKHRWPFIVIGLVAAGVVVLRMAGYSAEDPTARRLRETEALQRDAFTMCQSFVTDRLKAPRTAEFATYSEALIERLNDDDYDRRPFRVTAYVDAQNAFGALLRQQYICTVRPPLKDDPWLLVNLEMKGR